MNNIKHLNYGSLSSNILRMLVGQYRRILVRQLSALSQMTWHAPCLILLPFPFYDAYRIYVSEMHVRVLIFRNTDLVLYARNKI